MRALAAALVAVSVLGCAATSAVDRAIVLVRRDRPDQAEAVLRDRLAEAPRDVPARRMLVRVLASTGDLGKARAEAEVLAEQLGDGSPTPWIELGLALELAHRYDEALALYDRASDVAPADPAGPRVGGMRAARWGEAQLAEPRLREATLRGLDDAEVWHALGAVRLALGDRAGAERAYRAGLRRDPSALENRLGLATVAVARGDAAAALRHYDALVAARPRFADGHLGRSWALLTLGRLDDAERALDVAAAMGADRRALRAQVRELLRRRNAASGSPGAAPVRTEKVR